MTDRQRSSAVALVLRCGATAGVPGARDELRARAAAVTDWSVVFELASRHAIVPLVDRALSIAAPDLVPPEALARFRAATQAGAMSNLHLSGELVSAMRTLAVAGIDAMPFKGPTLATLAYGNLSLRQYQDLDVLVHRADVERSRRALISIGYTPVIAYNDDQRSSLMRSAHHEQLVRGLATIELHWSLNNRTLTHEQFEAQWWESRQEVEIGGMAMRTLGVERLVLYLCMHGGKHSWARLGWLFDLQFTLRSHPDVDWNIVWRLARANGTQRMLSIGIALLGGLLAEDALVADATRGRTRDVRAQELSAVLEQRISSDITLEEGLDFRVQFHSRERLRDRVRYTWHNLAAPHASDIGILRLPRRLHGMYYILRPMRLAWKNVVRHATGHP